MNIADIMIYSDKTDDLKEEGISYGQFIQRRVFSLFDKNIVILNIDHTELI